MASAAGLRRPGGKGEQWRRQSSSDSRELEPRIVPGADSHRPQPRAAALFQPPHDPIPADRVGRISVAYQAGKRETPAVPEVALSELCPRFRFVFRVRAVRAAAGAVWTD